MLVNLMLLLENNRAKALNLSIGSGTEMTYQDFGPGDMRGESVIATGVVVSNRAAAPGAAPADPGSFTSAVGTTLTPSPAAGAGDGPGRFVGSVAPSAQKPVRLAPPP